MIIPLIVTQSAPIRVQETQKDSEGESDISLPSLEDSQIAQKVEQVIQKARTRPRKEDKCILEGTTPFISRIFKT